MPGPRVAGHAGEWMAAYARFEAAAPAESARAVSVLRQILVEAADQAAVAARHGITDRTVRSDLRLAGELLLAWLGDLPPASADHAIEAGLALLPDWLHRPVGDKRNRILLYLALVERRLADQGA